MNSRHGRYNGSFTLWGLGPGEQYRPQWAEISRRQEPRRKGGKKVKQDQFDDYRDTINEDVAQIRNETKDELYAIKQRLAQLEVKTDRAEGRLTNLEVKDAHFTISMETVRAVFGDEFVGEIVMKAYNESKTPKPEDKPVDVDDYDWDDED